MSFPASILGLFRRRSTADPRNPSGQRATPIPVTPEQGQVLNFGEGIGPDPMKRQLLAERQGVPELAQRAIANRLSSIQWITKRSVRVDAETTEDEILDDHPITRLLENPHPDFSGRHLFRLLGEAIATVGEGYWYKVTNSFGRTAMFQMQQVGQTWPLVRNGVIQAWGHTDGKGQQRQLRRDDVVRFWWPELATLYTSRGYFGPNWIYNDTMKFQGEHMRSHWQNDATPKVILKAAQEFAENPDESGWRRFLGTWQNAYHGRSGVKRGLPARLPTGWDVVMVAAQSGADVTPLLEFLTREQLLNYGVPNALLGQVQSGDRSSAETVTWVFDTYTMLPIVEMVKEQLNREVVPDFDRTGDLFVDYVPFVAPDKEFELQQSVALIGAKVVSPNEVRTEQGRGEASWGELPPGTFGDQPYTGESTDNPFTSADEGEGETPDPEDDPSTDQDDLDEEEERKRVLQAFSPSRQWRYRRQVEGRWLGRMTGATAKVFRMQEAIALERFRKSQQRNVRAPGDELFDELEWGILWEQIVEPIRRRAYQETGQTTMALLGQRGGFELTPHVVSELRRQGADLVGRANSTTLQALRETLADGAYAGESVDQLERRVSEVFAGRRRNARTIAHTELLRAVEDAQVESFRQSGVVERKRWNSSRDGAVRDTHVESLISIVPVSQPFILPDGDQGMYPGASSFRAGNSINCRCFVTPVFDDEP